MLVLGDPVITSIRLWMSERPVRSVFLMALAARWLTAVALFLVAGGGPVFGDDGTYVQLASDAAAGATSHWSPYITGLYHETASYTYVLTGLFWVFGTSQLLAQLLTGVFGAAAAALATRLALEVLPVRFAVIVGLLVALVPSQVLWSSLTLKDATSWMLLCGVAVLVALSGRLSGVRLLWVVIAALGVLTLLNFTREHTFLVAVWALALTGWLISSRHRVLRGIAGVAVAVLLPVAFGHGLAGSRFVQEAGSLEEKRALNAQNAETAFVLPDLPPQEEQRLREARDRLEAARAHQAASEESRRGDGETGRDGDEEEEEAVDSMEEAERDLARIEREILPTHVPRPTLEEWLAIESQGGRTGSLRSDLAHLPRGLQVMLFEPLPWRSTGSSRMDLVRIEMAIWYPMLLLALAGLGALRDVRHRRVILWPVVAGGGLITMYALAEGNFGTAFRHRGEVVWIVAILAGFGMNELLNAGRRQRGGRGWGMTRRSSGTRGG